MNEPIGQIIRRLRKERNFTQEELAEQLGVTAQAVSKWESEIGLPDISQVVPLATVFGVPTDVLFGRAGVDDAEEVKRIIDEIERMDEGMTEENDLLTALEMMEKYRHALQIYPNNTLLLGNALAHSASTLLCRDDLRKKIGQEGMDDLCGECIRYAELIIKYSASLEEVLHAKRWLMSVYAGQNRYAEACQVAETLPADIGNFSGIRLAELKWQAGEIDGERQLRSENIRHLLIALEHQAVMMGNSYRNSGQYADALRCYQFLRDIAAALYEQGEYCPPFQNSTGGLYTFPAYCLLKLGKEEEVLDLLEESVAYLSAQKKHDNQTRQVEHPLLRECDFHSWVRESRSGADECLRNEGFSSLRDHPRYRAIAQSIEQ